MAVLVVVCLPCALTLRRHTHSTHPSTHPCTPSSPHPPPHALRMCMHTQWKVAPALAAGNCCILKPSELASVSCLEMAAIAHEAGVQLVLSLLLLLLQ